MPKRLIRKLDLKKLLSQAEMHPTPIPKLEQYTIPADVAATLLYIAAYSNDDIIGKTVLDLGCGTGRLALGAAFLGAKRVVGVDVDKAAIAVAFRNSVKTGLKKKVQWIAADISAISGVFDTVLQNPPYGVQTRGADKSFLEKALKTGTMIYSLHKHAHQDKTLFRKLQADPNGCVPVVPSPFLREFIARRGGRIKAAYALIMTIPHMFVFHSRRRHEFVVDLFVVERRLQTRISGYDSFGNLPIKKFIEKH